MNAHLGSVIRRARTYVSTYGFRATVREAISRARSRIMRRDAPNRFHVEISNCCNFACEYCVLRENATGDKVMSASTFAELLPFLTGASSVALSGLAEPLMNRRFVEILQQVRAVAPHAVISIDTNASLLSEPIAEAIVDSQLDSLVFSLDGTEPDLVDSIREGGSLEQLAENLRMLKRVKRQRDSSKPVVAATFVMQRKNVSQLPAAIRLAAELGATIMNVNGLEPYGEDLVDSALWTGRGHGGLAAVIAEADTTARQLGIKLRLPAPAPQQPHCPQMGRPVILADGTVVPCSVLAYRREGFVAVDANGQTRPRNSVTERLAFGNINESSIAEIWNSDGYRVFRQRVSASDFPAACSACVMKHNVICAGPPWTGSEFVKATHDSHALPT